MTGVFTQNSARKGLNKFHRFHLLDANIWPIATSMALLSLVLGMVSTFYDTKSLWFIHIMGYNVFLIVAFLFLLVCVFNWWGDVSHEAGCGEHTKYTVNGLKFGMILFIVSEVLFFFSFFWAFFHASVSPAIEVGGIWPPVGFNEAVLEFHKIPLLNTLLLLSSGVTVTYAHLCFNLSGDFGKPTYQAVLINDLKKSEVGFEKFLVLDSIRVYESQQKLIKGAWAMFITLLFATLFMLLQLVEYCEAYFNISDGVYGSTFFIMTGFHGLHVMVGTAFLVVSLLRLKDRAYFLGRHSTGLECAIWYWHFVDVVWLFLYISIYYWGNKFYLSEDLTVDVENSSFLLNTVLNETNMISSNVSADYATEYEIFFQDPATTFMEKIINLHNYIMYYLTFICFIFLFLVYEIVLA